MIADEIYAWVEVDEKGREGIVATDALGAIMPLVTSRPASAEKLRPFAVAHQRASGNVVRLLKWSGREMLEQLTPYRPVP